MSERIRDHATNYLIIAVGGTGAKVAEAAVNLLTIGMPMVDRDGKGCACLHEADTLTVVRVDPDKVSRDESLRHAVERYRQLRDLAGSGEPRGLWSLQLEELRSIHPMDSLSGPDSTETVRAKLASNADRQREALRLLRLFFEDAEIDTELSRGFFQKAHIGAGVIGAMGEHKRDTDSEIVDLLDRLKGKRMRAFIVGSMYGGTGASGIPVIAKIIKRFADQHDQSWQVAGCLMGPYFRPPSPPLQEIEWGEEWTPMGNESLDEFLVRTGTDERAYFEEVAQATAGKDPTGLGHDFSPEEIRQIARGFYAKPDEIQARTQASWEYYRHYGEDLFDHRYFLGLREPTRYDDVRLDRNDYPNEPLLSDRIPWSNGGRYQVSPLHSIEYAAAGLAFHFFSHKSDRVEGTALLGVEQRNNQWGSALSWADMAFGEGLDVDRYLYAALAGYNWVRYGLLQHIGDRGDFISSRKTLPALHEIVSPDEYEVFRRNLHSVLQGVGEALLHTKRALGWDPDTNSLQRAWLDTEVPFGTGGEIHDFGRWRMEEVDVETIGESVPGKATIAQARAQLQGKRGRGSLARRYLESAWTFMAQQMVEKQ